MENRQAAREARKRIDLQLMGKPKYDVNNSKLFKVNMDNELIQAD